MMNVLPVSELIKKTDNFGRTLNRVLALPEPERSQKLMGIIEEDSLLALTSKVSKHLDGDLKPKGTSVLLDYAFDNLPLLLCQQAIEDLDDRTRFTITEIRRMLETHFRRSEKDKIRYYGIETLIKMLPKEEQSEYKAKLAELIFV